MRIDKKIAVPQSVIDIKNIFKENGHELFVVGGAVRDSLLDAPIKDFDLATDAVPEKVKSMLKDKYGFVEEVGESFGVVFVIAGDDEFEIATFREESGYTDSRRPDDVKFSTIDKDVLRRDITFNALFYDIDKEQIVDLVGGIKDIEAGIVRTVGEAEDRFEEDRLRILRAIRFALRLNFKLDEGIVKYLESGGDITKISKERIRDEFVKCLKSTKSTIVLRSMLNKFGLDEQIFPGLSLVSFSDNTNNWEIKLALALQYNPIQKLKKILNKLTYKNDEVDRMSFLIDSLDICTDNVFEKKKAFMRSKLSKEELLEFHKLAGDGDTKLIKVFNEFEFSVSGDELIKKEGFTPGPDLGKEIKRRELEIFIDLKKEKGV